MADRWDELENAYPIVAASFPGVKPPVVKPMGFLEKLLGGGKNVATTDMDGSIHYNAAAARRDGRPAEQILAHEMQHVQQNAGRGWLERIVNTVRQGQLPWAERPDEIE